MKILCICHNTPYPPNKGDKIRTYHLLRALAQKHEVHLVSLAKNPADLQYAKTLEQWFASVHIIPVHSGLSKLYALLSLLLFKPLTLGFFFSFRLRAIIRKLDREHGFCASLSFCSSAAQYASLIKSTYRVVDFVDVDSEKWQQYANTHSFPKSMIYQYEAFTLRRLERSIHLNATYSLVTSDIEKQRLESRCGQACPSSFVVPQGVSLEYYTERKVTPIARRIVFTGQMDYFPNIDAVLTFYREILPRIRKEEPEVEFYIVGRNPDPLLEQVCTEATVTGEVEDIRQFLHTASVVVAPLRLAFGMQSKILEAMASGIPVVASDKASQSLWAQHEKDLLVASSPAQFAEQVLLLLRDSVKAGEIGRSGQKYVARNHDWEVITDALLGLFEDEDVVDLAGTGTAASSVHTPVRDGYEQVL